MTDQTQRLGTDNYRQDRIRQGRVSLATKIFQGVGSLPGSHKDFAFNSLLLLYYNQILGVSATTVATVLAVATVIDAVTDPLTGAFSDRLRSKLGRRHPLMYVGAIPLGVTMFLLFSPPTELSETALVVWLFTTVILLHLSFTIFVVPWNALAMEFTSDYAEQNLVEEVMHLTDKRGVNVVLDPVGGPVLEQSIACAAHRGRIVSVGTAGRDFDKVNTHGLAPGNKSLTGVFLGAEMATPRVHGMIASLVEKMAAGTLRMPINRTFALAEAAAAHAHIESRQAVGRVILVP